MASDGVPGVRLPGSVLHQAVRRAITDRPYGVRVVEMVAVRADTWVRPYDMARQPCRGGAMPRPQVGGHKPDLL